jgi:hypothetical protein
MSRRTKVLDRVLVLGRVATSDMTALRAHQELNPGVSQPHAFCAAAPGRPHVANVTDVRAHRWFLGFGHDAWKVLTSPRDVESIDSMKLMSRLDSRALSAIDAAHGDTLRIRSQAVAWANTAVPHRCESSAGRPPRAMQTRPTTAPRLHSRSCSVRTFAGTTSHQPGPKVRTLQPRWESCPKGHSPRSP